MPAVSSAVQSEYIAKLKKPLGLTCDATLQPLCAGQVNQVFLLKDKNAKWVVKGLQNDDFSGIDRHQQFALQHTLSTLKIAPEPVWMDDAQTVWVEYWVDDNIGNPTSDDERIVALAKTLSVIHQQHVEAPLLALPERLQHYLDKAQLDASHPLARQVNNVLHHCFNDEADTHYRTLCHNDISFGHIRSLCPLMVVDWEYAAIGHRFFDVAACAQINALSAVQAGALLRHYAEFCGLDLNDAMTQFRRQEKIVEVTAAVWQAALDKSRDPSGGG